MKNKRESIKYMQNSQKGITLVALVVTIVVLLILAGVTIALIMNNNGIINRAIEARDETKNKSDKEIADIEGLGNYINEQVGGSSSGGSTEGDTPPAEEVKDITTITTTEHETLKAKDAQGNIVTVPKGFKVVEGTPGEEISVQNGVVIEDSAGNQFVWIPVGTVNIIKDDGTKGSVSIELARYDFTTDASTASGSRTIKQLAKDYATDTPFTPTGYSWQVTEYATRENPDGLVDSSNHLNDLNAIAKDLAGFIDSVIGNEAKGIEANGGYYLARYEASKDETDNTKPASKYDKATWTSITQINAAVASRKMYLNHKDVNGKDVGIESDLVNSYAWDTAIAYIEKMKTANNNYANTKRGGDNPGSKLNTGKHNDSVCNIHDMSGNLCEWSTEYSTSTDSSRAFPCVYRGGYYYNSSYCTASRSDGYATRSSLDISFRLALYVK